MTGNHTAPNLPDSKDAWESNFLAVWHFGLDIFCEDVWSSATPSNFHFLTPLSGPILQKRIEHHRRLDRQQHRPQVVPIGHPKLLHGCHHAAGTEHRFVVKEQGGGNPWL